MSEFQKVLVLCALWGTVCAIYYVHKWITRGGMLGDARTVIINIATGGIAILAWLGSFFLTLWILKLCGGTPYDVGIFVMGVMPIIVMLKIADSADKAYCEANVCIVRKIWWWLFGRKSDENIRMCPIYISDNSNRSPNFAVAECPFGEKNRVPEEIAPGRRYYCGNCGKQLHIVVVRVASDPLPKENR